MERMNKEREIDQNRGKYREEIVKLEKEMDKVQREEDKNTREAEEQRAESADLADYEEKLKARIKGYQMEVKELEDFQKSMGKAVEKIDGNINEKDNSK